jgi:hypothetical protein
MQTYYYLPASPETGEELTAFARKKNLPHSLILKILVCVSFASFLLCERYILQSSAKEKLSL